ncbi:MAG TPA: DUF488 domain-containing protein [Chthoniobacterales bacterium]|nr:DUF488 domain-containing protein [Chthoniobacterales bacterium]
MITLYTIGFTEKSAEKFFSLLETHGVTKVVDTRISNASQLAGFAKGKDLAFFARRIGNMDYGHELAFAPTKELLDRYRAKQMTWDEYATAYVNLLDMRQIAKHVHIEDLHQNCLLCSEHSPEKCHRRLLAEYLRSKEPDLQIIHLE